MNTSTVAVIRRLSGSEESTHERLVRKHVPAWVVSGAVHLVIAVLLFFVFGGQIFDTPVSAKVIDTTTEKETEEEKPLTPEERGLDGNIDPAIADLNKITKETVEGIEGDDKLGVPDPRTEDRSPSKVPGLIAENNTGGTDGLTGPSLIGEGGQNSPLANTGYVGRDAGTKSKLIRDGGGSKESELAVGRGLGWLARQQKPNGSWVFDGTSSADTIAATGMCLLPFLAAGETHRFGKRHQATVERGLKYLLSQQKSDGSFTGGAVTMYSHGIATIALNEAYGMTKDRNLLLRPAQNATNFIVQKQAEDGSWGYSPGTAGDTSIVGWQIQALKAGILSGLLVPDKAIANAVKFLDKVSSGSRKAVYGYTGPNGAPGTSLTAVGLLSRYYISKWGPGNAGLAEGVDGLMKRGPGIAPAKPDMYYYYYATQVVHFADGPEWKDWNEGAMKNGLRTGGMRDWLIALQDKKEGLNAGSWENDGAIIGGSCGRIGTTALSLLTLEVYYRHLPLYKRENAGGIKILEGVK